jgi:hypothetical protein
MSIFATLWRAFLTALEVFGSTSCSELAEITILCILGLIASVLVITPGDQTFDALYLLCSSIGACY